ncbi:hypothetical protein BCR37DRAFT_387080 [Protomyces lactucae-debilis]|uniref:Uncharacterized protein n=1 Tax=Protomyces lactucae-debilis TaxID=2754530 RepID=A0A1Y2FH23_PROLT|nr:uncharacterized protein BCR37DRAFT_387080 [Protomyces lactucae-debilis]ORY83229.1 hypothetical protein BCR37DRAFT_387080 [Protomyces lactucae-debilis]
MIGSFIVGSSVGKIYFVQVSTKSHAVSLRTTLTVSFRECRQVLVDTSNKSFYVLDQNDEESPARLVTLAPTELGNIEEKSVCGTDLKGPSTFSLIGNYLYVLADTGYTILRGPKAPMTKRRRRTSKLEPVHEDLVAESLIELFAISHRMDTEDISDPGDPQPAIDVIKQHIHGETASDVVAMGMVIPCSDGEEPLLKLLPDGKDEFIFGLTRSSLTTYEVQEQDGSLVDCASHELEDDAIDMAVDDAASCFVLTRTSIVQLAIVGGGFLDEVETFSLPLAADEAVYSIHVAAYSLWIRCAERLLQVNILNGKTRSLPVVCRNLYVSLDAEMLITASESAMQLRDRDGKLLGERELEGLAEITRMS